ncbi:MAG TPA: DMT family transporter [Alphaproteobacteria bacterium]|nr:DMT family transporter [Alphaproteobacteria bacterium]
MQLSNNKMGIVLMISAILCYSCMDGIIRYLSQHYNVITLGMFRYWFFALFIIIFHSRKGKSLKIVSKSKMQFLQILRSVILTVELCFAHYCFYKIGLIQTASIFAVGPLIVTALSVFVLKEAVGWRRWTAITVGFIGILIILRPGINVFDPFSFIALGCAFLYAVYQVLTRLVSRYDNNDTTLFYTGIVGVIILSSIGPFFYKEVQAIDWLWIFIISILGLSAHFCIIKALQLAEASMLQPFSYLHLVFVSIIGILVFNEILETSVLVGSIIVVSAGLYTFWRENLKKS